MMKLFSMSTLFGTALFLYTSSTLVIAEDSSKLSIRKNLLRHCPKLSKGITVGSYLTTALVDTSLNILTNCENDVNQLCESLPELLQKYTAGGKEICQGDLKEHLCGRVNHELGNTYRLYEKTVQAILTQPDRWISGKESDICLLFEENSILCSIAKNNMCKHVRNHLVKSYCHRFISKNVCSGLVKK